MKLIITFLLYVSIPAFSISQQDRSVEIALGSKTVIKTTKTFYLKNTNFPKHFINHYSHLTKTYKKHSFPYSKKDPGYRTKDTVQANKQIALLSRYPQTSFSLLMKARLSWEFREHLLKEELLKAKSYLKNKKDSAFYFFTTGQYYKDSISEILARKLGFVRSKNDGYEYVDWKRMNNIRFSKWVLDSFTPGINSIDLTTTNIENAFVPFFEKAIMLDSSEFFFMVELLLPIIRMEDEKLIQKLIIKYRSNYTLTEQKWLEARMVESKKRELITNHPKIESLH